MSLISSLPFNTISSSEQSQDLTNYKSVEQLHRLNKETPSHLFEIPEVQIDPGLPILDTYNTDIFSILIQDPFRIYTYWEISSDTLASANKAFAPIEQFNILLRVTEKTSGKEFYYPIEIQGDFWFSVSPDQTYIAEIGIHSDELGFIKLLGTYEVTTPRGTIAQETESDSSSFSSALEFSKILLASGFSRQIDLVQQEAIETLLSKPITTSFLQSSSQSIQNIKIEYLPTTIREIIHNLMKNGDYELVMSSLLHYLPYILRDTHLQQLLEKTQQSNQLEWIEFTDFEEDEFVFTELLCFGTGSSAGSGIASMRRRKPRRIPIQKIPKPIIAAPSWFPSMTHSISGIGTKSLLTINNHITL